MQKNNNNSAPFLPYHEVETKPSWAALANSLQYAPPTTDEVVSRCFSLSSGRVIFGMLLRELEDSYIVGMPTVLVGDKDGVRGKSVVSEPTIRLFKSTLAFTCTVSDEYKSVYYRHVLDKHEAKGGALTDAQAAEMQVVLDKQTVKGKALVELLTSQEGDDDNDTRHYDCNKDYAPYNKKTRH